jgi:hypothetical protein
MSKKAKSQADASGIEANLVEGSRRAIEAEITDANKNPSVTNESEAPSPSISSAGINAESRPSAVTMNINKSNKWFFLRISIMTGSISKRLPFKIDNFLLHNSAPCFDPSFLILKNDKSNENSEIAFHASNG